MSVNKMKEINIETENEVKYFDRRKEKAEEVFSAQKTLYSPYIKTDVILNSDGFHHLQFSGRKERNKREQLLKFNLLLLALDIIRKSGTVQEYRRLLTPIGKSSAQNGSIPMKEVEYWGLMPYSKIKQGKQKIFSEGIEDE